MAEGNLKIEMHARLNDEGMVIGASNLRLVGEPGVVLGPILREAKCPPPPPKDLKVTITVDNFADIRIENIESAIVP